VSSCLLMIRPLPLLLSRIVRLLPGRPTPYNEGYAPREIRVSGRREYLTARGALAGDPPPLFLGSLRSVVLRVRARCLCNSVLLYRTDAREQLPRDCLVTQSLFPHLFGPFRLAPGQALVSLFLRRTSIYPQSHVVPIPSRHRRNAHSASHRV